MKVFSTYVPFSDASLAVWAHTYKTKLGQLGEGLGIASDVIAAQQELAQGIIDNINKVDAKKVELKEAVTLKNLVRQNNLQQIRNMAAQIKTLQGYTPNVGNELRIVAMGQAVDYGILKPSLAVTAFKGYVNVAFNKQRMFGVKLYGRLRGELEWKLLGMSRTSPFYDEAPLVEEGKPEIREYKAMCFDGEYEVGLESDVASLIYGG